MLRVTVKDVLKETSLLLKEISGDLSVLESRLLLCQTLNCRRADLIATPEKVLSSEQIAAYNAFIQRRLKGEPIAKICGIKEFWGIEFIVSKDTLDPRPDTEILVEAILDYVQPKQETYSILDLGTGSGCIILSVLRELTKAQGLGIDISPLALEIAEENSKALDLDDRARFLLSDWGQNLIGEFDIIASNPPYITEDDYLKLSNQVRDFEPKLALTGGNDGLECYKKIATVIDKHLACNGFFAIEIGEGQEEQVSQILNENNLSVLEIRKDLAGILRCIIGRRVSR